MSFNNDSSNNDCPCYRCTERVAEPNCHPTCDRYLKWQKKKAAQNDAARKEKQKNNTMSDAKRRILWKNKRYARQGNYSRLSKDHE